MEDNEFFKAVRHDTLIVNRLCHILSCDKTEILNHTMRVGLIAELALKKIREAHPDFAVGADDTEFIALVNKLRTGYENGVSTERYTDEDFSDDERRAVKLYSICAAHLMSVLLGYISGNAKEYYDKKGDIEANRNAFFKAQIPKDAELISMAQCYESMTSYIPYFPKRTADQGYRAIKKGGCGEFSDEVIEALNSVKDDIPEEIRFAKKVLIVDDQKISRVILSDMFRYDFGIIEAVTAEEGMELLKKHRGEIILVIVDYRLSGTRGIDFLHRFREDAANDGLPIAVGTLITNDDDTSLCYEYGADDLIYKPFERKEVRRRMLNLVELYEYKARR